MEQSFNLPSPPGFRGFNPQLPVTVYRRNLPHWRQDGATYFVTFRLGDALPQEKLAYLLRVREDWEQSHPPPRSTADWEIHSREVIRLAETWLDAGYGACHFRNRALADQLHENLLHFQDERYQLSCFVIMPNHCHLVVRPFDGFELETILQGIKGVTARCVNEMTGGSGSIWQEESFDRIVRDEEHLWRIVQYIGRNPEQAGLFADAWRRWIHPEWESLGWRF